MWCVALDVEFHLCVAWNCWERFEWSPIRSHWMLIECEDLVNFLQGMICIYGFDRKQAILFLKKINTATERRRLKIFFRCGATDFIIRRHLLPATSPAKKVCRHFCRWIRRLQRRNFEIPSPVDQWRAKIRQAYSVADNEILSLIIRIPSLIPSLFDTFLIVCVCLKDDHTLSDNWPPYLLSLCDPMNNDPLT